MRFILLRTIKMGLCAQPKQKQKRIRRNLTAKQQSKQILIDIKKRVLVNPLFCVVKVKTEFFSLMIFYAFNTYLLAKYCLEKIKHICYNNNILLRRKQ